MFLSAHAMSVIFFCAFAAAVAKTTDGDSVLKRLEITERIITLEDPQHVLKVLDPEEWERRRAGCDYKETCVEWQEDCMEFTEECTGGWYTECTGGWHEECTEFAQDCSQGWRSECTRTAQECVGGWDEECTRTTKNCKSWVSWLGWLCDGWSWVCSESKVVCNAWDTVCTATSEVCNGFTTVCHASKHVCEGFSDVCEGGTHAVCTSFSETCKASATVCQVGEDVVEAIVDAVGKFEQCIEDNWEDGTLFFDADGCSEATPLQNTQCYARAKGSFISDGFEAGCSVPDLKFGVEFGSIDGDKDTARYLISIGHWELDVPAFEDQWKQSPVKDYVHVNADIGFTWVNDAKLDVDGEGFELTLPGLKWDFEASLGFTAEHSKDPCADDINKCRMVLNKGKTTVFRKAFAAGPIPIVIEMSAEVYLGAYPKLEGAIAAGIKVFFEDHGVTLINSVSLPLDDGIDAVMDELESWVRGDQIRMEMEEKIRVEVTGSLEASASLDLCIGVVLGFHINGVGGEIDIPLCLNAALNIAANADLNGAELQVDASLKITPVELVFVFDLPDLSAAVDTACGFVQAPLAHAEQVGKCIPMVGCFSDLVDDTCEGVSDAVSALDLQIELASLEIVPEFEIWSHTVTLSTGSSTTDLAQTGFGQDHVQPRVKGVGLANDVFHDVPASRLGNFGFGDFSVSFTWRGKGGALTPDGEYGAIFIKSSQLAFPYTGPSAFVWDDGRIQFRVRADEKLNCPAGTFSNPTSTTPRKLKFSRKNRRLTVEIDGVQKCTMMTTLDPDLALFRDAPLRFGANHGNPKGQNLNAELSDFEFEQGNDAIGYYHHTRKACVQYAQLGTYTDRSLTQCSVLCDNNERCVAFNYEMGVETCMLKSDTTFTDCDNLDLYVKTAVIYEHREPVRLANNQKYDIPASRLGPLGRDDFTVEFTWKGLGSNSNMTPDGEYGALFIKSEPGEAYPYTGPSAFLWDDGRIQFRLRADDKLDCPAGTLSHPSSTTARKLKFSHVGGRLQVEVDGNIKCSKQTTLIPEFKRFRNAPLRFGGNHGNPNGQNFNAVVSDIRIAEGWNNVDIFWQRSEEINLSNNKHFDIPASALGAPKCMTKVNMDVKSGSFKHHAGSYQTGVTSDTECRGLCNAAVGCTAWVRQPSTNKCWLSEQTGNIEFETESDRNSGLACSGTFGAGDFAIELNWKGRGGHLTPDGTYGTLFIRSGQLEYPYTGPSAFVWDDGRIQFRLRGDDKLECNGALSSPTSSKTRRLKFVNAGGKLSILVDNVVKCTRTVTKLPDVNHFKNAPLRFGGNHGNSDGQNLNVRLSDIVLTKGVNNLEPVWRKNEVNLSNNKAVDAPAGSLGTFGAGDFAIEFTWKGKNGHLTPDGSYGALFIRSGKMDFPYTGPSAFLWDNGKIQFRLRGDDKMECPAGTLSNPTSTTERRMKFLHAEGKLQVIIDGVVKCTRTVSLIPNVNDFKNAPLRFGGNHGNKIYQNLNGKLLNVVLKTADL